MFDLEKKLGEVDLQKLFSENKKNIKVDISLPRFKLSHSLALSDSLQQMGMEDMFSDAKADFSGIAGKRGDLYVSSVFQKVFVEVNEEGSEAAAATAAIVSLTKCVPPPNQMFNVDHPFLFIIRDKLTGMILFQGRVVDPSA